MLVISLGSLYLELNTLPEVILYLVCIRFIVKWIEEVYSELKEEMK